MANHPQNGDLPAYPSTNIEEYLANLTMQAGAVYEDDGGKHPKNGDLPEYPSTNIEEYLAYLVEAGLGKVTKGYMYNGNFYEDLAHTKLITPKEGSIYYDVNENKMYVYLNAQYHSISTAQVGRFLSSWNAQTGLPTTNPGTVPYTYHTGDYYMITNVGTTNYKPSGSTYTGTASTTTETGNISDNDFYFYDGTTWFLLKNSHPEIPAVVQSTGTSTTSVMSQDAVTKTIGSPKVLTSADYNYPVNDPQYVALWLLEPGFYIRGDRDASIRFTTGQWDGNPSACGAFIVQKEYTSSLKIIIGFPNYWDTAQSQGTVAVWVNPTNGSSSGVYRCGTPVNDLTTTSTGRPLAANQGKVLKDLIDSYLTSGAGAPTTSTVGTVGKLYQDTTNGELYQCTAVSGSTYTWTKVGSPTIVQSTGTSTTDVMSQKASTELIFKPNTQPSSNVLKIGSISNRSSLDSIAIGWGGNGPSSQDSISIGNALCNGSDSIAIGAQGACSSGPYSIFIGRGDNGSSIKAGADSVAIGGLYPSAAGSMCVALGSNARTIDKVNGATAIGYMSRVGKAGTVGIGAYSGNNDASQDVAGTVYFNSRETAYGYNNSNYRLLTGLYDPQNDHDAATKGYVDTNAVGYSAQSVTSAQKAQARTNIGAVALEEYNASNPAQDGVIYYSI